VLQLQQLQTLPQLLECIVAVAAAHQQQLLLKQQPHESSQQEQQHQEQEENTSSVLLTWLDAAWRTVALLTAQSGACSSCSCSGDVATAAIAACLAVLQHPGSSATSATHQQQQSMLRPTGHGNYSAAASSSTAIQLSAAVQGNAALVLGHFAGEPCWHIQLAQVDAVGVLVAVAYAHGRGSAVARNAAIALARMAKDACLMDRLRELHGVEIIYQYVRP
jgi:hypothetical protein